MPVEQSERSPPAAGGARDAELKACDAWASRQRRRATRRGLRDWNVGLLHHTVHAGRQMLELLLARNACLDSQTARGTTVLVVGKFLGSAVKRRRNAFGTWCFAQSV